MKIEVKKRIGFYEVDAGFKLRSRSLLNYFQEAAGLHSEKVGYGSRSLLAKGNAWVLNKIAIEIYVPPLLGDELSIITWHKGLNGFRAYRDFEIYSRQEKLVAATSLWLFIDLDKKKILKVPEGVDKHYTVEDTDALDLNIDSWKPNMMFMPHATTVITTRPSDYDPLGHVNNAIYFDYLETLMEQAFKGNEAMQNVLVQFNQEIQKDVAEIEAGLKQLGNTYLFRLSSPGNVHALGEFAVFQD